MGNASRLEFARSRLHLRDDRCEYPVNVAIHPNVRIGEDVEIQSGAVIGHSGFGYEVDENGIPIEIVHLGRVIIGDHVRIGANCTVDRGTVDDTIIHEHVKIDQNCHIAHNVEIGPRTMIASGTILGGSCKIGEDVWIGPGTIMMNKIKVGDRAFIGVGSVVIRDVPAGMVVCGNPARVLRERRDDE